MTQGYELNIINGATNTLKETEFVIAEVRHNFESYKNGYKLEEFMLAIQKRFYIDKYIHCKALNCRSLFSST